MSKKIKMDPQNKYETTEHFLKLVDIVVSTTQPNYTTRHATIRALGLEMRYTDEVLKHNLICVPLSEYFHRVFYNERERDPELYAFLYNHCEEYLG